MGHSIDRRDILRLMAMTAAPLALPRIGAADARASPRTYVYKSAGGCDIHADVFIEGNRATRPVVLWIHGGALITGSRIGIPPVLVALARNRGYAIVSIDYRLAPNTKLPAIIEDVEDAYRWIRTEGPQKFGANPGRIAVAGGSAGGYLTLMAGFRFDPSPKALVAFWGYGDITAPWLSEPSAFYRKQPAVPREEADAAVAGPPVSMPPSGTARNRFYLYCRQNGLWPKEVAGHDPLAENRWFDPYCPIRNVSKRYPPTLLIHGTIDTDVPYEQSKDMAAKFAESGVEHELITVPGAGHGLAGAKPAELTRIYDRASAFLTSHLD
jgi:acetyl esterase/lipase